MIIVKGKLGGDRKHNVINSTRNSERPVREMLTLNEILTQPAKLVGCHTERTAHATQRTPDLARDAGQRPDATCALSKLVLQRLRDDNDAGEESGSGEDDKCPNSRNIKGTGSQGHSPGRETHAASLKMEIS